MMVGTRIIAYKVVLLNILFLEGQWCFSINYAVQVIFNSYIFANVNI